MKVHTALLLAASLALSGCGPAAADPVLENLIVKDYPTHNQTATSTNVMDCGKPDGDKVICHACNAEIIVDPDDAIVVYAETDEHTIEGYPKDPHLVVQGEVLKRDTVKVAAVDGQKEKAKGPASYQTYLTGLYQAGVTWCSQFPGKRYETKNVIADVAHGKYVK